ncbi:restriction endonuclease subunit S [Shouchella clausii]|jgi:type I restriction enzyme, S subunit|uniref:restriction endonuclease subunit S n=1 Tax=Shouchella clausii TaxID=79880 RepID=UPI000BA5FCFD|nr:restriction endonuclease subunit S [Shouchella clausii]MEB5478926.1 restriction endonuclease subunit S [Shouchella clausii]PAD11810.1 hypothetical protein CHH74_19125 [Shouchella clausii]
MVQHEINLPEGWVLKQIKDVAPLQRGFDLPASKVVSGKYPVCYSNGIANYHNEFKAEGPGVFTGRSGTIGNVFYVKENYWPHNTSLWVTDFKGNDRKFVYYLYQQVKLDRFNAGTGVPTLNRNDVHVHKIPIPKSAVEQQKIASILSTWDKAIELKEKLIEQKKEQKKGLMQKLLTGEMRLPGFDREWKEVILGSVLKERKEIGFDYLELLAITSNKGVVRRTEVDIKDNSSEDKSKYKRILPNDIGYNTMRMWQGVSGVSKYEGIVSPAYTILIPTEKVNPEFIGYLFKHPKVVNLFKRHSQGLVSDTLNLKYENFKVIKLVMPLDIEEQKRISEVLLCIDKEIEALQREVAAFISQKRGLMQSLLTGKVRVKV